MTRNHLIRSLPLAVLTLIALCAFPFAAVHAQSATATLSGTVEDANGAVIPSVSVAVVNLATGAQRQATTNEEGYFVISLLPPGRYQITAQHEGFTTLRIPEVVLNVGDQKSLQVQLKTGDIKETVVITGEASLISESPAVATTVDRQFVENIPLNGRSFQSLISLSPGFSFTRANSREPGQFSVNGQRADANYITVDGVSANFGINSGGQFTASASAGAQAAFGITGGTNNLVSVDALQEFKVQTSSYAPEFGRTAGAQVQIATRSGTSSFHGTAFDYLRNDVLDANDWFANANRQPRPPERQNDFGGTFAGPVVLPGYNGRARTFFFFSYEGLRLRQPQSVVTQVPSLFVRNQSAASVQPYLNAWPLPNGPDLVNAQGQTTGYARLAASYSDSLSLNATSIRIDQTLGARGTIFGRFNHAPSRQNTRSVQNLAALSDVTTNTDTLTIGATYVISPRVSNEARVNFSKFKNSAVGSLDTFTGATPPADRLQFPFLPASEGAVTSISLFYSGTLISWLVGPNTNMTQTQFNVVDATSVTAGNHQIKAGVDFRQLSPEFIANTYRIGVGFDDLNLLRSGIASTLSPLAMQSLRPRYNNISLYGQDTWRVSPRLTLTYGLRWEINPPPTERGGKDPLVLTNLDNPSAFAALPRGTPLYRTSYGNMAPRFGIAYQLRTNPGHEWVLRGGVGGFYSMGSEAASSVYTGYPYQVSRNQRNVAFPPTTAQLTPPPFPSNFVPPFTGIVNTFVPHLKTPITWQWNVASEQSFGSKQGLSVSYVGALGRRLLESRRFQSFNANFPSGVFLFDNAATSDYDALEVQYNRRLSRGLQALASYTWSHAIDEVSTALSAIVSTANVLERGSADFDVRHVFSGALTYNIPKSKGRKPLCAILENWAIDGIVHYQSAAPVNLIAGNILLPDGSTRTVRPDFVPGVPFYLDDPLAPGGRRLNPAAFTAPPKAANGQFIRQGTLGRNVVRGFSLSQFDLGVRRQFNLTERLLLQLKFEAFNIFNHPNFGVPDNSITSGTFGRPTQMFGRSFGGLSPIYQVGGPRSMQFGLRLGF